VSAAEALLVLSVVLEGSGSARVLLCGQVQLLLLLLLLLKVLLLPGVLLRGWLAQMQHVGLHGGGAAAADAAVAAA